MRAVRALRCHRLAPTRREPYPRRAGTEEDVITDSTVKDPPSAPSGSTAPAVELHGITKRFPGVVANKDIEITVRRGTVHAIVGENGAGKSTLMKILYGVQQPDEGTIDVNGQTLTLRSPTDAINAGIGMVFQHFMLADNLTVLENVVLGAEKLHGIGDEARKAIVDISDAYGLRVDPDVLVAELGVGKRQRVEILKVLFRGAKILILDEPTAVLVPQEVTELFDNLRELKSEGLTVIFISHKLDEVLSVADEITVIRRGTTVKGNIDPSTVNARQLAELMVGSELPSPQTQVYSVTDRAVLTVEHVNLDGATGGSRGPRGHLAHDPRRRDRRDRRGRGQRPGRARRGGDGDAGAHLRGDHPRRGGHLRLGGPGDPRGRGRVHPRGPAPTRDAARGAALGERHPRPPDRGAQRRCGRPHQRQGRQGRDRADRQGVRRPDAVDLRDRRLPLRRQPAEAHHRPRDVARP